MKYFFWTSETWKKWVFKNIQLRNIYRVCECYFSSIDFPLKLSHISYNAYANLCKTNPESNRKTNHESNNHGTTIRNLFKFFIIINQLYVLWSTNSFVIRTEDFEILRYLSKWPFREIPEKVLKTCRELSRNILIPLSFHISNWWTWNRIMESTVMLMKFV